MPILVHLTSEANVGAIRRSGIRGSFVEDGLEVGVYCFPVLPNYFVTNQWLRELKRNGQRTFVAIHFRVPSDEMVWVGHFGERHLHLTADQAIGEIMRVPDPRGFQIILPRSVHAKEIHRIRSVPQVTGWRYQPESHLRTPCPCIVCLPIGSIRSRMIRQRSNDVPAGYGQIIAELVATPADDEDMICWHLYRLRGRTRRNASDLAYLLSHPSDSVQKDLAITLSDFRGRKATEMLLALCSHTNPDVRSAAAKSLLERLGKAAIPLLEPFDTNDVRAVVTEFVAKAETV